MQRWADRVYAYGVPADAGWYECVDCGHRQGHEPRGPMPPCPYYRDSTHLRAAWRDSRESSATAAEG